METLKKLLQKYDPGLNILFSEDAYTLSGEDFPRDFYSITFKEKFNQEKMSEIFESINNLAKENGIYLRTIGIMDKNSKGISEIFFYADKEFPEAEKTTIKIEPETPEKSLCDDLKKDWIDFVQLVKNLDENGVDINELRTIKEEVKKYNINHPDKPIITKTTTDGKVTTHNFRRTPC